MSDTLVAESKPTQPKWRRYAAILVLALTAAAAVYQFQGSKTYDVEIIVRLGQLEVRGEPVTAGGFTPLLTRDQLIGLSLRLLNPDGQVVARTVFDFETTGAAIQVSTGRIPLPPMKYTAAFIGTFVTEKGPKVTKQWSVPAVVEADGSIELTL
ncbi:MAG: hypothetical protein HUU55_02835 [Myxococcales bacterium]|nr:hypothetical protein [Myxococcales bacterium]